MALTRVETELDTAVAELDGVLAHGEGPVRLDENGDLGAGGGVLSCPWVP